MNIFNIFINFDLEIKITKAIFSFDLMKEYFLLHFQIIKNQMKKWMLQQ